MRARWRGTAAVAGKPMSIASAALGALVLFVGWIGGEVLVFHSGMAVKAAGLGALAPPLVRHWNRPPRDLEESMDRVRSSWSDVTTRAAKMVALAPRGPELEAVERSARVIEDTARWMQTDGPKTMPDPRGPMPSLHDEHHDHVLRGLSQAEPMPATRADHLVAMARDLEGHASAVEAAAHAQSLDGVMTAAGALGAECSDCHSELRW
jgi:hypothetical protein